MSPWATNTDATKIIGCAVKFKSAFVNSQFLQLYDGATLGMNVSITVTGELAVARGGTVLGTTSGVGISAGTWFYLEFKTVCNNTTGSYELRVDGETVLSDSGVDTQAGTHAYYQAFALKGTSGFDTSAVIFDDLYCLDSSGDDNNDFLGVCRVAAIRPSAAGDSTEFTPDSGDNYSRVDEEEVDDDTSYVEDSTSDHADLYEYGSVDSASFVYGVQVCTDCKETDVTPFDIKIECKSGDTTSDDSGQTIGSTDYVTECRVIESDPDTSEQWLSSGVNSAQFGFKVG